MQSIYKQSSSPQKMLLMGRSGAGKTSIHSILFAKMPVKNTCNIGYSTEVAQSRIQFIGNLCLDLWDCPGQDKFMQDYFTTRKEEIFSRVFVMIYLFDITNVGTEFDNDQKEYLECLQLLHTYSKDAKVSILLNKLDRVAPQLRTELFNHKKSVITSISEQRKKKNIYIMALYRHLL